MTLLDASPATLAEIPAVIEAGCTSFKTYLTYAGFKLEDDAFIAALEAVGRAGGIALVHAENDAGIRYLQHKLLAEGHVAPNYHPLSRPAGLEAEAIERALALAEIAGCPLYVVHISTRRGAEAVSRARARGQMAIGETCPQYLLLTDAEYDLPGFEGAKFICSPPLRKAADNAALWAHLAADDLSTVGTDHCPFFYAGQKNLGTPDASATVQPHPRRDARRRVTAGLAVHIRRRRGRLSLERWVEVCCAEPARVLGLAGRKGTLTVGADADVVIFDPEREVTISRSILHENCDYTPYEGYRLKGYPVCTMLRGRVIVRNDEFVGEPGGGKFLVREISRQVDKSRQGSRWILVSSSTCFLVYPLKEATHVRHPSLARLAHRHPRPAAERALGRACRGGSNRRCCAER